MNDLNKSIVKSFSNKSFLIAVGILLITTMLNGCEKKAKEAQVAPFPEVDVATVLFQSIQQWDQFNGHISAIESVDIRPRVSGYIQRLHSKKGMKFKKEIYCFS